MILKVRSSSVSISTSCTQFKYGLHYSVYSPTKPPTRLKSYPTETTTFNDTEDSERFFLAVVVIFLVERTVNTLPHHPNTICYLSSKAYKRDISLAWTPPPTTNCLPSPQSNQCRKDPHGEGACLGGERTSRRSQNENRDKAGEEGTERLRD